MLIFLGVPFFLVSDFFLEDVSGAVSDPKLSRVVWFAYRTSVTLCESLALEKTLAESMTGRDGLNRRDGE